MALRNAMLFFLIATVMLTIASGSRQSAMDAFNEGRRQAQKAFNEGRNRAKCAVGFC